MKRCVSRLGFARRASARSGVGLRPASADGLPILGPVPGIANLMLATGHGSTGLQLGPYSGKVIADMIVRGEAEVDISVLGVQRFP
jgi:D-amino-acid dehydrogenase